MKRVFEKPKSLTDETLTYCPGCTHGIIHRLVAEAIDGLDVQSKAIGVAPVGCAVFAYNFFACDMMQAAHGRAPAVATGIKRVLPNNVVFTYQGDGDLASIGMAEIMHAAGRGEKITTIFVNNAIYGMTGGQMAPTTLLGQVTTTSPYGRQEEQCGKPIRMSELIAQMEGTAYVARVSVHDPRHVIDAGKAIRKAFEAQLNDVGFSMIEVLSTCPTNWGMTPIESLKWVATDMIPYFPLGVFKDVAKEAA